MIRASLLILASIGLWFGVATSARAEGTDNDFEVVNKTGYVIDAVFVSPHDAKKWGDDILGKDVLNDGETLKITFHPEADADHYDLKVKYKDDNSEVIWPNLELPKINKLTLHWDAKEQKTSAEVE